jgi:hypothetical protein
MSEASLASLHLESIYQSGEWGPGKADEHYCIDLAGVKGERSLPSRRGKSA